MCLLDEWTQVFWPKQEENFLDSRTDIQVSIKPHRKCRYSSSKTKQNKLGYLPNKNKWVYKTWHFRLTDCQNHIHFAIFLWDLKKVHLRPPTSPPPPISV